jgi:hypothetical protein
VREVAALSMRGRSSILVKLQLPVLRVTFKLDRERTVSESVLACLRFDEPVVTGRTRDIVGVGFELTILVELRLGTDFGAFDQIFESNRQKFSGRPI